MTTPARCTRPAAAYPVEKDPPGDAAWLWNGAMSTYRKAGFVEMTHVARLRAADLATVGRFDGLPEYALAVVVDASVAHHAGHRTTVERWLEHERT